MKRLSFVLALLCLISSIIAQNQPSLEAQLKAAFSTLNVSDMPTGILYDKVPEYLRYKDYNGTNLADSVLGSSAKYRFMYGMIKHGHVVPNNMPIDSLVDALIDKASTSDTAILGGLYYRYHYTKQDAITLGLISWNGTNFMDVNPRPYSPYVVDTMIAFTAMRHKFSKLNIPFRMDPSLLFHNINLNISSLLIDFGNGAGWQSVALGSTYNILYPDYGTKYIIIKYTDASGQVFQSRTRIDIKQPGSNANGGIESRGTKIISL